MDIDERLDEETSSAYIEKTDDASMKRLGQLQPYGPELYKLLDIRYPYDQTDDKYHPTYQTYSYGRSLDESVIKEENKKEENDTAFLLEIGACFRSAVEDFAMSNMLRKTSNGEK